MDEQQIDPSSMEPTLKVDDLKLIKGIGPAIERRLNAAEIYTYSQLAALSPNDLALLFTNLTGLTTERIAQQDWVGQARQLASITEELELRPAVSNGYQHYSVYMVELLLDENNDVRRTNVVQVQSQETLQWAGWDEKRLLNFINPKPSQQLSLNDEAVQVITDKGASQPLPPPFEVKIPKSTAPEIFGVMKLTDVQIKTTELEGSQHLIRSNQPFRSELLLDLEQVGLPRNNSIHYSASIIAKKEGSGLHQFVVGSSDGEFTPADKVSLTVEDLQLPGGLYRIEALVKLTPPWQCAKPEARLMAMKEGCLLQVY